MGEPPRIPLFQVAVMIHPEVDIAQIEAAAAGLLTFGQEIQAVEHVAFLVVEMPEGQDPKLSKMA